MTGMVTRGPILLGAKFGQAFDLDLAQRQKVEALEALIGRKVGFDNVSCSWGTPGSKCVTFPAVDRALWNAQNGRRTMLSVMNSFDLNHKSASGASGQDIIDGVYDDMIRAGARELKSVPGDPVIIRLLNETANAGDPLAFYGAPGGISVGNRAVRGALYVAVWEHYVGLFRSEGATNVEFAWVPGINRFSRDGTPSGDYPFFLPPLDIVDYMGVDNYQKDGGTVLSFADDVLFKSFYQQVSGLGKRLFWVETGANSNPSFAYDPQTAWIDSIETFLPSNYPLVVGVGWWNLPVSPFSQSNPGFTGSYFLSGNGLQSFKRMASNPYFGGPVPATASDAFTFTI